MIEIHLGGKPVTKLQAARAVAAVNGESVCIGEPNPDGWIRDYITVYARHPAFGEVQPPKLSCMSFSADTVAGMQQQAQMITLAAEICELAEMLAAEQDAPKLPLCRYCDVEPATGRDYCEACAAAAELVAPPVNGPLDRTVAEDGIRGLRTGDIVTVPAAYRTDRRRAVVESVSFDGLSFTDTTGVRHYAGDAELIPLAGAAPETAPPSP